jgi:Flp pilus assembly pilin Flp
MSHLRIRALFLKDESAATAVEYALIAGFIALVIARTGVPIKANGRKE